MIIDQSTLSGKRAYLLDFPENLNAAKINLARGNLQEPPVTGKTQTVGEGMILEVDGINIQLEGENLNAIFNRQNTPLLTVRVEKEMFPELFADPYAHRIHNIGGFEDFGRGKADGFQVMEVEGVPTLVSLGDDWCNWTSPVYRMPHQITLVAAAWEMATSRLTPEEGFKYTLILNVWKAPQTIADDPEPKVLTDNGANNDRFGPGEPRFNDRFEVDGVTAYQLYFEAKVNYDVLLRERHVRAPDAGSMGRPLLQAVNLFESLNSPIHHFYSLQELLLKSADYHLFEAGKTPLKKITAYLDVTATLTEGESISLTVHSADFSYLEARLDATVLVRPPRAEGSD